ncbi:LCP family protein [Candidatus Microgenomates bacterium]|nr:LCP family protein [Candidatus Microgenomates bacterium]
MAKTKVMRFLLLFLILGLIFAPFYLLRSYFAIGFKFINTDYSKLKSKDGITSVLILGKGGEGHTAPDLTDTIINIFVSQNSKKLSLLPLPRDIWIPEIRAKINSAYYWDKQRENKNYELTRLAVEGVVGKRPDYLVVVNFSMFKDLVEALGGIEVVVENSFVDNKFPIPGLEEDLCDGDKTYGCRYETIQFEEGLQTMDGETSLKFVRSRNSEGNEGTDIAREARQQKVIAAIKNKTLSSEIILEPKSIISVLNSVLNNVETDFDIESAIVLARVLLDSKDNVHSLTIPEDFLEVSKNIYKYDYQYVFIPRNGNWSDFSTTLPNQIY